MTCGHYKAYLPLDPGQPLLRTRMSSHRATVGPAKWPGELRSWSVNIVATRLQVSITLLMAPKMHMCMIGEECPLVLSAMSKSA